MLLLSLVTSFALAQAPGSDRVTTAKVVPTHENMDSVKETAEETLVEAEVSRTERAQRMKKILEEVRKDLNDRREARKKSQAPKSDDNTRTN